MEVPLSPLPVVFAKVRGKKGLRELRAIISPASEYTVISNRDALQMGYDAFLARGAGALAITPGGIIKAAVVKIEEISVGDCSAKGVEALCYELPEPAAVDVILGKTFLENFSLVFDYGEKVLKMVPHAEASQISVSQAESKTRSSS